MSSATLTRLGELETRCGALQAEISAARTRLVLTTDTAEQRVLLRRIDSLETERHAARVQLRAVLEEAGLTV